MKEGLAPKMLCQPKLASSVFNYMKTSELCVGFVKGGLATCVKVDGTNAVTFLSEGTRERPRVTG